MTNHYKNTSPLSTIDEFLTSFFCADGDTVTGYKMRLRNKIEQHVPENLSLKKTFLFVETEKSCNVLKQHVSM